MDDKTIIAILLVFILLREAMFYVSIQKLLNKLMARDFSDYSFHSKPVKKEKKPKHGLESEIYEEMQYIDGINSVVMK